MNNRTRNLDTGVETAAGEAPAPAAASRRGPRLGSLAWQGVVGLLALFSLIFMGIALVMSTYGRQQVAEQSAGKLEEAGKRRVEEVRRWLASGSPLDPSNLQRLSQAWKGEASGYAFLLDRDQRFLTFPRPELVGLTSRGGAGKAGASLTAGEVADRHPGFRPIAGARRRAAVRRCRPAARSVSKCPPICSTGNLPWPSSSRCPGPTGSWSRSRPSASWSRPRTASPARCCC